MSSAGPKRNPELDTVSSRTAVGRILDAALALITRKGDASVTMAQIARAARVSRQAVYLHFSDRAALMVAIARHLDDRLGLSADVQAIRDAPDAAAMLDALVAMQARRNPSVWAVARALDAVRRTDAAAERAWQDRLTTRLEGCRAIVARIQAENRLRPGLDAHVATDLLWSMTSLRAWEDLVLERGWPAERYRQELTRVVRHALMRQA